MNENITVLSHPLIYHSLTILREKTTTTEEFRRRAGLFLFEG